MTSSVLNGDIMVRIRDILDYWGTLKTNYYTIISYQWINVYRVERMDVGQISLTHWRQWIMQMQPSH